ncbi:hypothetical protein [Catenovulum adriaticum]|uniref:Uncharacterized protein n=1 Tax=Catenovulum adriaticum TaxID=2984846 RepID=A0ABY7ARE8_9ALTE|nr:hypothetical protein [Catenovulum sp. TS8]WAJ71828.1 hypothetical protein OLW01_15950 [Catenovulum sp. TS8]
MTNLINKKQLRIVGSVLALAIGISGCIIDDNTRSQTRLKTELPAESTTPDLSSIQFSSKTALLPNSWQESDMIKIFGLGIGVHIPIEIFGGEYSINGGQFTSAAGTVKNRDEIVVRVTSSAEFNQSTSAQLALGDNGEYSSEFVVTTSTQTTSVNAFNIAEKTKLTPSTDEVPQFAVSDAITPEGFNVPVAAYVESGMISIDGGDYVAADTIVKIAPGQSLQVKTPELSKDMGAIAHVVVHVGNQQAIFSARNQIEAFYGINFNQIIEDYANGDFTAQIDGKNTDVVAAVDALDSKWVRGFAQQFDLMELEPNSNKRLNAEADLKALKALKARGHKVAFNMKWDFNTNDPQTGRVRAYPDGNGGTKPFPTAGTAEMDLFLAHTRTMLEHMWDSIDLIVVGNEPFIEVPDEYRPGGNAPGLADFYITMAEFVMDYKTEQNSQTPVYIGAFNNLQHSNNWRNEQSTKLLEYARDTAGIAGVDVHIHHSTYDEIKQVMDYVTQDINLGNKNIITTEFSFMRKWKNHTKDQLNANFATKYGYNSDMLVHEYLSQLIQVDGATSKAQWDDFVTMNAWYADNQDYLDASYKVFNSYPQFAAGFYAFRQTIGTQFDQSTDPWILNGIYVNRTVKLTDGDKLQLNYNFHNDFNKLRCSFSDPDC